MNTPPFVVLLLVASLVCLGSEFASAQNATESVPHSIPIPFSERLRPVEAETVEALAAAHLREAETLAASDPEAAVAHFSMALDLAPAGADPAPESPAAKAFLGRAEAFVRMGLDEEALPDFASLIRLFPKRAEFPTRRGASLARLGRTVEALADFGRAIGLEPSQAPARVYRARLYRNLNRVDEALADYESAVHSAPKDAALRFERGRYRLVLGDAAKALADVDAALSLDSDHVEALGLSAWIRSTSLDPKLRDGKRALVQARKALEINGGRDPVYLSTYAAALAETGQFAEAARIQELVVLTAVESEDPELLREQIDALESYKRKTPLRR